MPTNTGKGFRTSGGSARHSLPSALRVTSGMVHPTWPVATRTTRRRLETPMTLPAASSGAPPSSVPVCRGEAKGLDPFYCSLLSSFADLQRSPSPTETLLQAVVLAALDTPAKARALPGAVATVAVPFKLPYVVTRVRRFFFHIVLFFCPRLSLAPCHTRIPQNRHRRTRLRTWESCKRRERTANPTAPPARGQKGMQQTSVSRGVKPSPS